MTGCGAIAGSDEEETCNPYNTTSGMLASTTGNIYGVYDMSGGALERIMGTEVDENGTFNNSNAGFTSTSYPEAKYYDYYAYSESYTTHGRGKLGDATKETLKTYGDSEGGWNDDYASLPYSGDSWFLRGGYVGNGSHSGVFHFYYSSGSAYRNNSSRAVAFR